MSIMGCLRACEGVPHTHRCLPESSQQRKCQVSLLAPFDPGGNPGTERLCGFPGHPASMGTAGELGGGGGGWYFSYIYCTGRLILITLSWNPEPAAGRRTQVEVSG